MKYMRPHVLLWGIYCRYHNEPLQGCLRRGVSSSVTSRSLYDDHRHRCTA